MSCPSSTTDDTCRLFVSRDSYVPVRKSASETKSISDLRRVTSTHPYIPVVYSPRRKECYSQPRNKPAQVPVCKLIVWQGRQQSERTIVRFQQGTTQKLFVRQARRQSHLRVGVCDLQLSKLPSHVLHMRTQHTHLDHIDHSKRRRGQGWLAGWLSTSLGQAAAFSTNHQHFLFPFGQSNDSPLLPPPPPPPRSHPFPFSSPAVRTRVISSTVHDDSQGLIRKKKKRKWSGTYSPP
jgi:hypothetical protein